jgi:outer membrane protein TolC
MPNRLWHIVVLNFCVAGMAAAQEPAASPLPDPLTLEYALSLAEDGHPDIQASRNLINTMAARREQVESENDYSASLNGRLRWINLPAGVGLTDDHAVGITVEKPLLDFGLSAEREKAAQLYEAGAREKYLDTLQAHREEIMRRYFDVLLADLQFSRENEHMAVAFIRLDRARKRQEMGQVDDLQILKLDREYQKVRRDRYYYEGQQRITRARLALAMNRPGQLPSDLNKPELPQLDRKPPPVEKLQALAKQHNPLLIALRKDVQGAEAALAAARKSDGLTVSAEMGYHSYTFQPAAREDWRLGLKFNYPLSTGGRSDARVALALTDLHKAQNNLREAERKVEQAVLEAWMRLGTLGIERQEMLALNDYQGLTLDKTRLRYEQEMQADLGDSMVLTTDAEYRLRKTEYQLALGWTHLEGLVGVAYEQFPKQEDNNAGVE